ncbi:MAG: hypothetical protein JNM63_13165 [Spirochaetia bacterium]|nr:hypothetical protein [Spirochaetia bacterium]
MKYDAQFLYLGLVSAGVPGATLIANERLRDGKIYADDCFEILIAPHVAKGEKETVYKIDVNSLGVFCDSKRFDAAAWNAQITASAKVENDIFQAELRIPWSDLGTSSDSSKEIAINIIRSFKGTPRPIYAGLCASEKFLDPDSYARVSLAGEGDGLQVQYFDALQSGSIRTVSQLNNITLGHSQSLTLKKGSETILNDSSTARFGIDNFGKAVVEMAFPKSERKFTLDMEIKDVPGRILFRRQVPFAANENLGIELDIISQKQLVVVRANTFGLTDLKEGSYDLVYQIFKKGETSPLISEVLSAPTKGLHSRDLSIAKLGDGPHEARISIVDKKGAQLLSKSKDFQIFKNPPWLGNTLGITDKVPAPWVPVIFRKDGSTVEVWGRTYRFAKSPFPEETAVLGERIFSRPAVLFVKFPGENEGTAPRMPQN